MTMIERSSKFNRLDKILLAVAFVSLIVGIYFLVQGDFDLSFEPERDGDPFAKITYIENDSRQKYVSSLDWRPSRKKQKVFLGDSIFSGQKSFTQVQLRDNTLIDIGENSLVTFSEAASAVALWDGNYALKIDGAVKVYIRGELTELRGKKSTVQIYIPKNKPVAIRAVHGEIAVTAPQQTPRNLAESEYVVLREEPIPAVQESTPAISEKVVLENQIEATSEAPRVDHVAPAPQKVKTTSHKKRKAPRKIAAVPVPESLPEPSPAAQEHMEIPSMPQAFEKRHPFYLLLGQETHSLSFEQSNSGLSQEGAFQASSLQGVAMELGYRFSEKLGLNGFFGVSQLQMKPSSNLTVDREDLQLSHYGFSGNWTAFDNGHSSAAFGLGVGHKQVPFLAEGSGTDVVLSAYGLNYVGLTGEYNYNLSETWLMLLAGQYRQAFSASAPAGSNFSLKDGHEMGLDLGLEYRFLQWMRMGSVFEYRTATHRYGYVPESAAPTEGESRLSEGNLILYFKFDLL